MALGVVAGDVGRDVLQHDRFTGFRRCHDQTTLPLADRRAEVDHTAGQIFGGTVTGFHHQTLGREQRRQVFKQNFVLGVLWAVEVNRVDLEQSEITLAFFGRANLANNGVASAQVKAADLAWGNVDVVRAGQVRGIGGTKEAEAVLEDLQHAITGDFLTAFRVLFQQRENHVLLARAGHIFYAHLLG